MNRHLLEVLGTCASLIAATALAAGNEFPVKPVRIIVPNPPGGTVELVARSVGQVITPALGQNVIVDLRPGGNNIIGSEIVARAPADGYTLFMGGLSTNAVLAHLTRLAFDPAKDLLPIIHVATFPNVLVVNPGLPVKSVRELVAYAQANPGKLSYA